MAILPGGMAIGFAGETSSDQASGVMETAAEVVAGARVCVGRCRVRPCFGDTGDPEVVSVGDGVVS